MAKVLTVVTLLSAGFAAVVAPTLPGSLPRAQVLALVAGLVAQVAATLLVSRRQDRPHLGFAATALVSAGIVLAGEPWSELMTVGAVAWIPVALAWAAARVFEYHRTRWQLVVSLVLGVGYLVAVGSQADGGWARGTTALAAAVPILGSLTVMLALRLRRARLDQLESLARQRVAAEREQLAAEIHDTLGRHLTLLVLRANTLTLTADDPAVKEAGEQLSGFGSAALTDLRRLVGLLHSTAAPTPVDDQVAVSAQELVAEAQAAGQQVQLTERGTSTPLSPALGRTVQRVVQEGLTNARRHAPDSEVAVELTVADELEVVVRNSATGSSAGVVQPGGGLGLEALRRRVELLGGRCESGPEPSGGYALRVRLPRVRHG
ncbi:sensor histidine kinase [Kribbella italica]|uniref:histidine kinase n=1 Tax=Kribbella italica TaxID=1540520 RepID=A0A7W9J459_9ACTN|nr:histidine kinase [Kribbella italica]MBB5835059.1 signal transduction histidine kinase [Kribbella italica]